MKTARLLAMTRLFLLFILSVILPLAGHSSTYTSLLSWSDWGSSSKDTEKRGEALGEINKLSFIGNNPPLLLTYDRKTLAESGNAVSELENNQLYIILDSQPGDLFNFCFRTPPALSTGHFPSPPVIKKPVTGQGMTDIQNGRMRRVASIPDSGFQQHEYSARWRLPAGNQSLVLAIEDNDNGWVIEPECSGILSENAALKSSSGSNASDSKKASFVDIFYRNKQPVQNGPGKPDGSSRFSGPFAIPGTSETADNSEPYISSGGGGFGGGDDLDDLFKKKPGNGMAPLYSYELTSQPVSRMILVPVADGQTVKKQIWDTRIVLKIKRGWNEQAIIISQELWNKIRGANLERSSGFFLALSRNPDNPKAAFDHYLSSHSAQPLQTEDYRRYAQHEFILSPKQLRSVTVFPGHVPTGTSHSGGSSEAEKQMADLSETSPANTQFKQDNGRESRGSRGGNGSGGDDGSGRFSNTGLCQNCNKPVLAFNKCKECLDRESSVLEQEPTKKLLPLAGTVRKIPASEINVVEQGSTEEQPLAIRQDREIPVSGTKDADTSAIEVFQWFKSLKLNDRRRANLFHANHHYIFPEIYNLLTHSFFLDKNALSDFHSKWIRFVENNVSLYDLILYVVELAISQGVEEHLEVTRIIKAIALYRNVYMGEVALVQFKNELLTSLVGNNLLISDDSDQVFYSGLVREKKAVLINSIYQLFKKTGHLLQRETVPSGFKTIEMLNKLARDVYAKYNFGFPVIYGRGFDIVMWGYANRGQYSFITPSNKNNLLEMASHQTLQSLALNVSVDGSSEYEDVRAMFTALVLIRSMLSHRLSTMFPEHVHFAEKLPGKQLELLRDFTFKARKKLIEALELSEPEERDEFIRNMFLIFGMVPRELSDQLSWEVNHEFFPLTQAAEYVSKHPRYHPFKTGTPQAVIMKAPLPLGELLNIGLKLGKDWKNFARQTGVFNNHNLRSIDDDIDEDDGKAMEMLERWKKRKVELTFKDLLLVLEKIKRNDLKREIMDRYGL
ncbi:death domain-containing protein [Endozoicomonas sp. 8E]|uniref:death domain-containing protein n=1 Tax=Endozoicomonas sp. 8E TaxID=3035692 RepID=UPI002938EF5E|nr:death domain-containing protein [Endozoicomonas sp. 8E]WOG30155.1 death domain-containing protein [Endozoicomonas sp. 8E]